MSADWKRAAWGIFWPIKVMRFLFLFLFKINEKIAMCESRVEDYLEKIVVSTCVNMSKNNYFMRPLSIMILAA